MSNIINKAKELISYFLQSNYSDKECEVVKKEIESIVGESFELVNGSVVGYETLQEALGTINEKEYFRKNKGVYYTPQDVVNFVIDNALKLHDDSLLLKDKCVLNSKKARIEDICSKTVFDPTCGAGEFLLAFANRMLSSMGSNSSKKQIFETIGNVFGNDINEESIIIAKLRLLICVVHHFGVEEIDGLSTILNSNFTTDDFVADSTHYQPRFDFIVGNPPYVEDGKSGTTQRKNSATFIVMS